MIDFIYSFLTIVYQMVPFLRFGPWSRYSLYSCFLLIRIFQTG